MRCKLKTYLDNYDNEPHNASMSRVFKKLYTADQSDSYTHVGQTDVGNWEV